MIGDVITALAEFSNTPGGKLLITTAGAVASALGLWIKQWWSHRKTRLEMAAKAATQTVQDEEHEREEERDWELRCIRTEADLERYDAYVQRINLKITRTMAFWQQAIIQLAKTPNNQEAQVLAGQLQYIITDLEVELAAHEQERPKYIARLQRQAPNVASEEQLIKKAGE